MAGTLAQGDGQVVLAQSNRANKHHVRGGLDELEAEELFDGHLVDLLWPAPLVLIEGLAVGEAGLAEAPFQYLLEGLKDLALDQPVEVVAVGHPIAGSLFG